jgi:uncharacterized protein YdaU (DUF1376 family)
VSRNGHLPYFPFYVRDYQCDAKVRLMNYEQRGMYMELLCFAWYEDPPGTLPGEEEMVGLLLGLSAEVWSENKVRVMGPFELKEGRYRQKRMLEEAGIAKAKHQAQVEGGRKGGLRQASGKL